MIDAGKAVAAYFGDEIFPGDVVYRNDPAYEGSHLPDMTMYKPVFHEGELVFWTANKSHMMDTGGPVAGGYNPYAEDIYAEGLRSAAQALRARRERRRVIDLLLTNVRIHAPCAATCAPSSRLSPGQSRVASLARPLRARNGQALPRRAARPGRADHARADRAHA